MEERSLRIYNSEKTFFSKLTNTLTKIIVPTQIGINSVLISMKRNNVLKAYEGTLEDTENQEKKESAKKKFEDVYALYLEAVDKHIMDSIYKKVKNDTATDFEKNALSKYYTVIHLKDSEYLEYKYRKQIYLLELDYQSLKRSEKTKLLDKYKTFYIKEMDVLYKGLLKHYSIKLADNLTYGTKEETYNKIFATVEEYIVNVLPLKFEQNKSKEYAQILEDYNNFEKFTVGKLDQNDNIEKNMILLSISRKLFTHSLPLIVAEQCYIKLLKDVRSLIVDTKVVRKQEKAYSLLIKLIEEYNIKLLSTKIYWDKPSDREEYKEFWKKYQKISELKGINNAEYNEQIEILFITNDLKKVYANENKYYKIIKFYKNKLVELGAMRNLKNSFTSNIKLYSKAGTLCKR
ncbi:MAG: hypothetical protein U0N02_02150 [Clostridia bacterium]|jgi:hypothetical protein|nr:hypothetical protein [Clostridiales bacterium]